MPAGFRPPERGRVGRARDRNVSPYGYTIGTHDAFTVSRTKVGINPSFLATRRIPYFPLPRDSREDLQEKTIRDAQYDPNLYYPPANYPELMEEWPTKKPLFIPEEEVPASMKRRMKKTKE